MPRILIADDNEQVRTLLSTVLSNEKDWEVCRTATNGRQAVLMASECKPDLVILDLAMPMLDGLHAGSEIMKFASGIPMILFTLHKSDQLDVEAKKAGFSKTVSKEEGIEALIANVHELLERAMNPVAPVSITNPVAFVDNSSKPAGSDPSPCAAQGRDLGDIAKD